MGLFYLGESTLDAHGFDFIVGMANTCRIDKTESDTLQIDGIFNDIAGSAFYV